MTQVGAGFSKESRMRFTESTNSDRKSGGSGEPALSEVEGDLQFHFRAQRMRRGRIASGFRFSMHAMSGAHGLSPSPHA
jgi:hypothetical protein